MFSTISSRVTKRWASTSATMTIDANTVAAFAATASALFAGAQIRLSRRESKTRSTFEHLREIEKRVQAVRHRVLGELCTRTVEAFNRKCELDDDCRAYLALLDSLELLGSACRMKTVNVNEVVRYLKPILREELVTMSALRELRALWREPAIYEGVEELFLLAERDRLSHAKRGLGMTSKERPSPPPPPLPPTPPTGNPDKAGIPLGPPPPPPPKKGL